MTQSFEERKKETGYDLIYKGKVTENRILNPNGLKKCRHFTINLPGIGNKVIPGDYIGLFTENQANEVDRLITVSGISADDQVTVREQKSGWNGTIKWQEELTVKEALTQWIHIEEPKEELLKELLRRSGNANSAKQKLTSLLKPENSAELKKFMASNTVADVLEYFPEIKISAQELCDFSHNLDQRRFTITDIKPDSISIVESPIEYEIPKISLSENAEPNTINRKGVFTRHADKIKAGDSLKFYIGASDFGLPWKVREKPIADDPKALSAPMIFIGAGTGIAPYLPMLTEMEKENYCGQSWLITGNHSEETGFLYKDKLDDFRKKGVLGKLSFAASRQENRKKQHVQDIVVEQGAEIWKQLQQGGYLYLCGDRAIEDDIKNILKNIAIEHGGITSNEADKWFDNLQHSGHFQSHTYRQSQEFEKQNATPDLKPIRLDVAVIGSGAAGCSAAMYAARSGHSVGMFTGDDNGGKLSRYKGNDVIENYPGFNEPIPANELMRRMMEQAKQSGSKVFNTTITAIDLGKPPFHLTDEVGRKYVADSVIIATGAKERALGIPGEKELYGHGVYSCAICDGYGYKDKDVVVVGGGDSAMEEALKLSKMGARVTIIHRRGSFRASDASVKHLQEAEPPIKVLWDSELTKITPDAELNGVESVTIRNNNTGTLNELATSAVFVAIGQEPESNLFKGQLKTDKNGHIITYGDGGETSVRGVFAAGEIMDKYSSGTTHSQAITSAGDGAASAMAASAFINGIASPKQQGANLQQQNNTLRALSILTIASVVIAGILKLGEQSTKHTSSIAA